jgi:indoleamine 2,3-dioxygenase
MPRIEMWSKSKPHDYTSFRTFIFGIAKQTMFPNGVIYEGVSDEPMFFRGESGANDSMIPLSDNLLEISLPSNPLTSILKDFRSYRPGNHREFLEYVQGYASDVGIKAFALDDPESAVLYLEALNQVRDFRWRHWNFTREYILKQTKHATATGGSPIVTVSDLHVSKILRTYPMKTADLTNCQWLPNQLQAVMDQMVEAQFHCRKVTVVENIMDLVKLQKDSLQKDVDKYCQERGVSKTEV